MAWGEGGGVGAGRERGRRWVWALRADGFVWQEYVWDREEVHVEVEA